MSLRRSFVVVALGALAIVLTACADDHHGAMDDGHGMGGGHGHERTSQTVAGARVIPVRASSYAFDPDRIELAAGEDVTIALRSTDIFHDFVTKDAGHVVGAEADTTRRGGLRIDEPGTYRFWCSVPGHREAGMEGTVVVE
jgi:plastocyanin